jgi:hypothetical protein
MYINYINDRQELGFSCIKDIGGIKQLSNLKSTLKNPVSWIIRKGKQTVVLIFSKEVLVAVLIFVESISGNINPNLYDLSFSSAEVYQFSVSKPANFGFLTASSQMPDFILKLKGGSDELTNEEQERLVKSILAKAPQSDYSEISINKFLKKILKLMDPVISDQRFWRILSEFGKLIKSELPGPSEVGSTDIFGPYAPDKQAKIRSRGSSSIFAEALNIPNTRKLSSMQKRVQLKMAKNNFSNNLESSGLSRNHEQLSKDIQSIEKLTKLRRAQPLYPSQVLGDSFKYGGKQLERKAPRHLEDFGISTEGKTVEEMAIEYKDLLEMIVSKPNLVIREYGTLNKQEPTINIGDPKSRGIVSFENNPLYEDHHFISGYPISEEAFETFKETGNIGSSPEERAQEINELQRTQAQAEREKTTARSFYSSLRIGNQQLREVETLQEQLKQDPSISLTEKEKNMIQRAEKYQEYKKKFYQDNPDIDRDEF